MPIDTLSLDGKIAIITGSGRENGIGAGIARALARNGAAVVINHLSDSTAQRAANVAEEIQEAGGKAIVVQSEIDTPEGAQNIIRKTLSGFETDHIDILGELPCLVSRFDYLRHPSLHVAKLTASRSSEQCRLWLRQPTPRS